MESTVRILQRSLQRSGKNGGGFLQLFVSKRLIQGAAAALTSIFIPIFLYKTSGEQFYIVGGYFALLSLLYVLFIVFGMFVTNYIGLSKSLVLAGFLSVCQYITMYFMTPDNLMILLMPLTFFIVMVRIFHWVPYHVDFTLFTKKGERARVVSLSFATIAFLGVVGPILAGFIIFHAGYNALFGVAVVLLIAATISYTFVPATDVHFDWSYFETWKKLFSKDMRGMVTGEFANGIEVAVTVVVWPIFLYELLNGNVFEIGAVSTIIVGVTIVIQLVVGRYLDGKKGVKEQTLKVGSALYALGWIFKIFVLSTAQIFFVGLYHNIVRIFTKTPFSTILYDMSAEQGKYIDEFTVLREMSSHSGRAVGLTTISILTFFIPLGWTFVIAALASLALNMVYQFHNQ